MRDGCCGACFGGVEFWYGFEGFAVDGGNGGTAADELVRGLGFDGGGGSV